jgi:hypothetical protein
MSGRPSEYQDWESTINRTLTELLRQSERQEGMLVDILRELETMGRRLDASATAHAALVAKNEALDARLQLLQRRVDDLEGMLGAHPAAEGPRP